MWEDDQLVHTRDPVFALADAQRRRTHPTVVSVYRARNPVEAEVTGWSVQTTDSGERITCFRPELTALAVETCYAQIDPDDYRVQQLVRATGYFDESRSGSPPPGGRSRLRRAVSVLIRDTRFRGKVLEAYGLRCAMCDLGLSLVQGAHIYPASAPDSKDNLNNGIALCANHQLSFDRHRIAVLPGNHEIVSHPDVLDQADDDVAVQQFIGQTHSTMVHPRGAGAPSDNMLHRRYTYFAHEYD